jgi:dihydroxyacetone kinase
VDSKLLDASVRLACDRAIRSEPDLTKWDMVMGDGDCGEAVKGVSEGMFDNTLPIPRLSADMTAVLKILDNGLAKSGSIFEFLYAVIDAVDDMGGTLGAIFGILLAALATSLRTRKTGGDGDLMSIIAPALTHAVNALKNHTGARKGDRTVMDVLLPFQETLESTRNFGNAVEEAERAAAGTKYLRPKFGRASYVGAGGDEQKLPDPGAWALMEIVKGLYDASAK